MLDGAFGLWGDNGWGQYGEQRGPKSAREGLGNLSKITYESPMNH